MTATEMVDEEEGGAAEVVEEAAEEVAEEVDTGTMVIGDNQVTPTLTNPTNPRHPVLLALIKGQPPHILLAVQTWPSVI